VDLVNLFDYETAARDRLDRNAFDYYFHGANDEVTLRENRSAFDRIPLRYRVLTGLPNRDLSTSVLGHPISLPVLTAPTAFHKLAHPDGEVATVTATGAAGTAMFLSTLSTASGRSWTRPWHCAERARSPTSPPTCSRWAAAPYTLGPCKV